MTLDEICAHLRRSDSAQAGGRQENLAFQKSHRNRLCSVTRLERPSKCHMHFTSGLASPLPFASVILKARKLAVSNAMKTAPHKVRGAMVSPTGRCRTVK
jgi:hypothetical protein